MSYYKILRLTRIRHPLTDWIVWESTKYDKKLNLQGFELKVFSWIFNIACTIHTILCFCEKQQYRILRISRVIRRK